MPRRHRLPWATALWLCVFGTSVGCAPDYDIESCDVRCSGPCPSGFVCERGYCVLEGRDKACQEPVSLSIDEEMPVHFACEDWVVEVQAEDGVGELEWAVELGNDAGAGVDLSSETRRAQLTVPGGSLLPGAHVLQVTVQDEIGEGAELDIDFELRECTRVATEQLDAVCVETPFALALAAESGFENYRWELVEDGKLPDWVTLTPDGTLSGEPTPGTERSSYELTVRVIDAEDPAEPQGRTFEDEHTLPLTVEDCLRAQVTPEYPAGFCDGEDFEAEIVPLGGEGPYRVEVLKLPLGVQFNAETNTLSGQPSSIGDNTIEGVVSDSQEEVPFEFSLEVFECPRVESSGLVACVDEMFEQQLVATPAGDTLSWSKRAGPAWLNLDELTGVLSGVPDEPGTSNLELDVSNDQGTRQQDLEVLVHAAEHCPALAPPPGELPDACAGQLYEHRIDEGLGSQTWEYSSAGPEWLELDSDTGRLHGTPPLDASSSYQLKMNRWSSTNEVPTSIVRTLHVWQSCRFAFLGEEDGTQKLLLADARKSHEGDAIDLGEDLPAGVEPQGFEFAPDGSRLAFWASDEQGDRVVIHPIATLELVAPRAEVSLPNAGRVEDLIWLENGQTVVLRYHDESSTYLLAIDASGELPVVGEAQLISSRWLDDLVQLGPDACYFTETALSPDLPQVSLACHGVSDGNRLSTAASARPLSSVVVFEEPLDVQYRVAGPHFLLFTQPEPKAQYSGQHTYYDGVRSELYAMLYGVPSPNMVWLAQPGGFLARNEEHPVVGIFALGPEQTSIDGAVPISEVTDCHEVLAWAADGRALACQGHEGLRVALLDDGGSVESAQPVEDSGDIEAALAKTFSTGGEWFAYVNADEQLKGVELGAGSWRSVVLRDGVRAGNELRPLSPTSVLLHAADRLVRIDLADVEEVSLSQSLPELLQCERHFSTLGPDRWCGGTAKPGRYALSAERLGLAFVNAQGHVFSVDLSAFDEPTESELTMQSLQVSAVSVACGELTCSEQLRFSK